MVGLVAWAVLAGWVAPEAQAIEGLQWRIGTEPVRYQIHTRTFLAEVMMLRAELNLDVRIGEFWLDAVVSCVATEPPGKRATPVACTFEDVLLRAEAVAADAERLAPVLTEYDQRLTGAVAQFELTHDGRIVGFGLEGVRRNNTRTIDQAETMRLIALRAFAALDLGLPKGGDDKGKGSWTQRESAALWFPSSQGTMGAAQIRHRVVSFTDSEVTLATEARGTLGSGATVMINGAEQPANLFSMNLEGDARFDIAKGQLIERVYTVRGVPTASSINAEGLAGLEYISGAGASRLAPDERLAPLGDSRPLTAADRGN